MNYITTIRQMLLTQQQKRKLKAEETKAAKEQAEREYWAKRSHAY